MKSIPFRFLSLLLALLLILPAAVAEQEQDFSYVVEAGWDDFVRETAEDAGGGFRKICDELPLQVWIPASMTEKETAADADGGKVISSWYCSYCNADIDFILYPEPPLPRTVETVAGHSDPENESYAYLNLINGIPALNISLWEKTDPDDIPADIYQLDYMYYYPDGGPCLAIRMRYLTEEMYNAEYTMSILHYSVSPVS